MLSNLDLTPFGSSISSRILRRAQTLAKLPEHDQKSVLRMIDALAAATGKGRKVAVR